jgi:hypothetical protein
MLSTAKRSMIELSLQIPEPSAVSDNETAATPLVRADLQPSQLLIGI